MFGLLRKEQDLLPRLHIEGFRVLLRPPRESDATEFLNIRARNKSYLKPYEPEWADDALTRDFFLRRLQKQARNWNEGRGNYFLIFKKHDNAIIGGMNINSIVRSGSPHAALGYWIDEDHQGQGFMAEAMRLIVGYCFESLRLSDIRAATLPRNTRSRNLLTRAGFVELGLVESYLQIDGRQQDHILYSLKFQNWLDRQGA